MTRDQEGLLSSYRILDLTDPKGVYCAKILADMGADVIQVEPPGGNPARKIGPFHHDAPHPEKSLFWFAYNGNKRSVTLNLDTADGRKLFARLAAGADVVIESFDPGRMADLGLAYDDLCRIKPDIVMTSITPYGQEGPYCNFQASDLTLWSMGGFAFLTGDADRPPVQMSFPQAYLAGAGEAAVATMIALFHREMSGEGQHVDVSIQASVVKNMMNAHLFWQENRVNLKRAGQYRVGLSSASGQRVIWKCKDGYVSFFFWGGKTGVRTNKALVAAMDEAGMAPEFMKAMDWENFDSSTATDALFEKLQEAVGKFFGAHTKAELFREAVKRRMTLYPVQDAADISGDTQLSHRGFYREIAHPELGESIAYPAFPAHLSGDVKMTNGRAPLIGEHNGEIYGRELGLSPEDLIKLKMAGVL